MLKLDDKGNIQSAKQISVSQKAKFNGKDKFERKKGTIRKSIKTEIDEKGKIQQTRETAVNKIAKFDEIDKFDRKEKTMAFVMQRTPTKVSGNEEIEETGKQVDKETENRQKTRLGRQYAYFEIEKRV